MERPRFFKEDYGIEKADEGEMNYVLLHFGYTMDSDKLKVPKVPYDCVEPAPNTAKVGLPLKKWSTQVDEVASPTALYLCLDNNETNTRLILSHLVVSQFHQINTTLQYVHM